MLPLFSFLLIFLVNSLTGQTGIGTSTPEPSAQLDVSSTTKGFLPPRMTEAERDAISSPADGLVIYQTDGAVGLYVRSSSAWVKLDSNGGGTTQYLAKAYCLRLEYNTSGDLVTDVNSHSFVTSTGYESNGASLTSASIQGDAMFVNVVFANETNPPKGILVYAFQPMNYQYVVHHYNIDSGYMRLKPNSQNFTSDGNKFTPLMFGNFGNQLTTIELDVRKDYVKFGSAAGLPIIRNPHAYLVFTF